MGHIVPNIAKGRARELYNRVKTNDPANSVIVLVPLEASGIASDADLEDFDTLAAILAGSTNEQTTMGRITLTDAQIAAMPAPDDVNDWAEFELPNFGWTAATGNAIAKIAVCYRPDSTGGTDADIVPMVIFDFAATPSGLDINVTGGDVFRAT